MSKNSKDETNYLAIGISLGIIFGVVFGLLVFDNLTIGLGFELGKKALNIDSRQA